MCWLSEVGAREVWWCGGGGVCSDEDICLWKLHGSGGRCGMWGVDVGVSADLELVDGFCLGVMLGVIADVGAAVGSRVRVRWSGFGQLIPLLTNKDISLIVRGRLYSSCV